MTSKSKRLFEIFEEKIPKYYKTNTIRKSQVQMAFDIAEFIQQSNKKKIMIIEAPVGTGKSLGALVPTLVDIDDNKRSIVYATATINLQGQLMGNEIPLLKDLSLVKHPIVAKGKSHYYCHKRFKSNSLKFSPKEQQLLNDFYIKAETGQRSELEETFKTDFSDPKWKKIELEATSSDCKWCDFSLSCTTRDHRKKFRSTENDLIITNHDQLIVSYLNILFDTKGGPIIPINPGIIIIDEAHHFIENFLGRLEESFFLYKLKSLARSLTKKWERKFNLHYKNIERIVMRHKPNVNGSLQGRYPIPEDVFAHIQEIYSIVNQSLTETEMETQFGQRYSNKSDNLEQWLMLLKKFLDKEYVKWIDYEDLKFSAISDTFPTDFRNMMDLITANNKVIVMSGTLTTNGDFESLINQWRLRNSQVSTKRFYTPFDYKNQAMIYVPENINDPNQTNFIESILGIVESLINLTKGRTLILNTSKEHMNAFWEFLNPKMKEMDIDLYLQGESGSEKLTKQFRDNETSVLIGTGSFFSGFSIPGTSLTSVILNKLPFPVKDDPFLQLIGQGYEGSDFFNYITFPHMINKLNQGAGRLIRSIEDYGIFTVLDKRIFNTKYGEMVQKVLADQGYIITRSWQEIEQFYNTKLANGSEADYQEYSRESIEVHESLKIPIKKNKSNDSKLSPVQKPKNNTKTTKRGVTKKQREFVKEFCEVEGISHVTGSTSEAIYKKLIDTLYFEWKDTQKLKDNFPYRDEEEKHLLQKLKGSNRKIIMPECTRLGCDSLCQDPEKEKIKKYLHDKYEVQSVEFLKWKSFCRVKVEPVKILENEEFRPV